MAKCWQLADRVVAVLLIVFSLVFTVSASTSTVTAAGGLEAPSGDAGSLDAVDNLWLSIESRTSIKDDARFDEIGKIIVVVVRMLIVGAAVCFMALVLLAGYKLVFAGDKEKQLSSAKSNFMTGLTGLAVLAAAWWIVQLVSQVLGMNVPMS